MTQREKYIKINDKNELRRRLKGSNNVLTKMQNFTKKKEKLEKKMKNTGHI